MTENTTEKQADENKGKEELVRCPCCGKLTLQKPLKPNQDLVDQWLSCMLTATPFHHTYQVYDGRMKITATQLSSEDIDLVDDLVSTLQYVKDMDWSSPERGGSCPVRVDQMLGASRLYISILVVSITSEGTEKTYKPAAMVKAAAGIVKGKETAIRAGASVDEWIPALKECERLLLAPENMSAVPLPMIMGVAEAHNRLSRILMDTGFDDAFWEGIELA